MSFLGRIRRRKSKDEVFQGKKVKIGKVKLLKSKKNKRASQMETCGTDFLLPQDFECHVREDHPDIPSKPE